MQIHRNVERNDVSLFVENVFVEHKDLIQGFCTSMGSQMNEGIYTVENISGKVVAASAHCSIWHPYCIYVRLAFDFNCVDDCAIKFMIEFLKEEFKMPLFFLIDDRFSRVAELLVREDFRLIRKTEVINIKPEILTSEYDVRDKEIKTVAQILNDPILLSDLIGICKKVYTETHLDNPVADLPNSSWEKIILDDLIDSSSYVVVNEKNIIAFSLMYEGDGSSWELGWLGVANSGEIALLNLVLNKQLHDANEHKIEYIEKEVDTTCPYSLHIVKSLTYDVSETWYAFLE